MLNLVRQAREKGYITYKEINDNLPEEFPTEQVGTLILGMENYGINITNFD